VPRWNVKIAVDDPTAKDLLTAVRAIDTDFLVGDTTFTVTVTADTAQVASEWVDAHLISHGQLGTTAIVSVMERGATADTEEAS
jgi:hypothetical protein